MTNRLSRRGIAGLAALPAALFVGSAQAQTTTESAFDRVTRTKVLRVAAFPGALPYFTKDISTGQWAGACVEMANDLAKVFDAKVEYVESGYGPAVLDLQTNKIDLAFALNPTPARALSITFTKPMMIHPFGAILKPGMEAKTWADINKPDVRIVVDRGSAHDVAAHRFAPKAQIIVVDKPDEAVLTMLSGRADVNILAAMLALSTLGKNPALGLRRWQMMRHVILPQATRRMLPPFINQSIIHLKNTSLVSTIAVPDLLYQAQAITAETYRPLETYTAVALIYFLLLFPTTLLAQAYERRLNAGR